MPEFLTGQPFWLVFGFLFVLGMLRGQGTYWIGRVMTEQTLRRIRPTAGWQLRAHRALSGEGTQRGVRAIRRWGLVIVPFCYLTVGFQTMVLAGAGVLRIGWIRFTLAQVPGALAWAAIYSTIGFAVWNAAIAAAAGSPVGIAALVAILVAAVITVVVVRRRRRRVTATDTGKSASSHDVSPIHRSTGTQHATGGRDVPSPPEAPSTQDAPISKV